MTRLTKNKLYILIITYMPHFCNVKFILKRVTGKKQESEGLRVKGKTRVIIDVIQMFLQEIQLFSRDHFAP